MVQPGRAALRLLSLPSRRSRPAVGNFAHRAAGRWRARIVGAGLTIRPSRRRFAARLNSGVSCCCSFCRIGWRSSSALGFGHSSLAKQSRPAPWPHPGQRYSIPPSCQCRRSGAGQCGFAGFGSQACAGCSDRLSLRHRQRAQRLSPPLRFVPAAVAANKSLKPTPHHRCVKGSGRRCIVGSQPSHCGAA